MFFFSLLNLKLNAVFSFTGYQGCEAGLASSLLEQRSLTPASFTSCVTSVDLNTADVSSQISNNDIMSSRRTRLVDRG